MSDYPMLISNKLHSFRNFLPQINDIVSARLYKTEEGKLRGEAPFFEGIWIIKEK